MPHNTDELTSDLLILGGGSAGCILANRLSADPKVKVTLLEAGGWAKDPDIAKPDMWPFIQGRAFDWDFETTPQAGTADRVHRWARGRVLGGSSNLHAMFHVRGHREDFARWAEVSGDDRWSYDGLLPAFKATENWNIPEDALHASDGPMPIMLPDETQSHPLVKDYIKGWVALGMPRLRDHCGEHLIGTAPNALMIRDGKRVTTADAWLTPEVLARPNLTIIENAPVQRLILDGTKVIAVEVASTNGPIRYEADEIILSLGAIGSPTTLMRSGIGDPARLAAAGVDCVIERPEIGKNLHDHLLAAGNIYRAKREIVPSKLQISESLSYQAEDPTRTEGRPDIVVGCVAAPSASEMFDNAPAPGEGFTLLFGVTNPTSRGELTITGPNLSDPVKIDPNYLATEHDRHMFRVALKRARSIGQSDALAPWIAEEIQPSPEDLVDDDAMDAFIAKAAITHHHPVATCRMGADDDAIVDADLKMRGLDNLWIVDSSIIPEITAGPIHAAVMAIAESFAASRMGNAPRAALG
ncbi:GMC family oxidoreductase [Celeribacter sp. PS-C1]|uniref:GMC family oxidoreductase n=1 Tax=Celeribacter sp. PS-C1 TaxID=2820813 RepID=UPI001CA5D423|nr:GMC family oxidoreductase N-terminal domain-containing protein [Celeribacter sp. PS-C1]MBW6417637.1 GMC family oxidoreductase N-terminal domain-containing protein [Celeribacter sp. PS-C1]